MGLTEGLEVFCLVVLVFSQSPKHFKITGIEYILTRDVNIDSVWCISGGRFLNSLSPVLFDVVYAFSTLYGSGLLGQTVSRFLNGFLLLQKNKRTIIVYIHITQLCDITCLWENMAKCLARAEHLPCKAATVLPSLPLPSKFQFISLQPSWKQTIICTVSRANEEAPAITKALWEKVKTSCAQLLADVDRRQKCTHVKN